MLNAENITLHYGSSQILHGVSVLAKLGEITCVMGSNGVGKTSLLRVLSGTHPSSSGTYEPVSYTHLTLPTNTTV